MQYKAKAAPAHSAKRSHPLLRAASIVVNVLLYLFILFMAVVLIGAKGGNSGVSIGPYRLLTVLTGSMRPTLVPGDVILIREAGREELAVGDVITFIQKDGEELITHRIVGLNPSGGYITQGDANRSADHYAVGIDRVLGRQVLRLPRLGLLFGFFRSPKGLLAMAAALLAVLLGRAAFGMGAKAAGPERTVYKANSANQADKRPGKQTINPN